jgi:hypothetical protein
MIFKAKGDFMMAEWSVGVPEVWETLLPSPLLRHVARRAEAQNAQNRLLGKAWENIKFKDQEGN